MNLRQRKFGDQIRDILATHLSQGGVPDPDLSSVMITRVKVSPDLQIATIYFRFFSEGSTDKALAAFALHKGQLRKLLGSELISRRVPDIRFFYDEAQDQVDLVESLLHKIHKEK